MRHGPGPRASGADARRGRRRKPVDGERTGNRVGRRGGQVRREGDQQAGRGPAAPAAAPTGHSNPNVHELRRLVRRAVARRGKLLDDPQTNVARLLHGAAEGPAGLVIEKFGDVLIAQLHEQRMEINGALARRLCEDVKRVVGARAVYRKIFPRDRAAAEARLRKLHCDPRPWIGEPVEPELTVLENGVKLLIRPYDGYSVGLFLEHRDNRRLIRELAAGRWVLNAFAYTCGFSVCAALGGAAGTVNVDVSASHLEWGKRNFAANGLALDDHLFFRSDVFAYLRRAARQRRRFGLIVLDAPTFGRSKKPRGVFSITEDLDRLVEQAAELLEPEGFVFLASNHRLTSRRRLEQAVERVGLRVVRRPRLASDFAGDAAYSKSVLARRD